MKFLQKESNLYPCALLIRAYFYLDGALGMRLIYLQYFGYLDPDMRRVSPGQLHAKCTENLTRKSKSMQKFLSLRYIEDAYPSLLSSATPTIMPITMNGNGTPRKKIKE